jgi:hypothetical protein
VDRYDHRSGVMNVLSAQRDKLRMGLGVLAASFDIPLHCTSDAVFTRGIPLAYERAHTPIDDLTGLESDVNSFRMHDLVGGVLEDKGHERRVLRRIGRALIHVWADRLRGQAPDRSFLFYLGGRDTLILRFHTERSSIPHWTDITDLQFLRRCRIEVHRSSLAGLERVDAADTSTR